MINLKLEDKIILGIGVLFLIFLLTFISLANRIFNHIEEQNKRWELSIQKIQPIQTTQTAPPETIMETKESEDAFDRLGKAFEENRKKRDEAFTAMEKNFKERFKKAAAEQEKRMKHLHKWFDESTARSTAEFDRKAAAFSAGLPKYAIAGKQRKKQHDPHK
jgi:hypothetical protein